MQVKTYRGKDVTVLLDQIRQELGEDAIILSTNAQSGSLIEIHARQGASSEKLKTLLVEHGLKEKHADKMSERQDLGVSMDENVTRALGRVLSFNSSLPLKSSFVALCGATGVGKTTTIAKLAAQLRLAFDMKIGFIAADSYRVGAGYQLQSYASLLNLPFRMVERGVPVGKGIENAAKRLERCDLVLVDTPGFSPRNGRDLEPLCGELSRLSWMEKILVLPAPSNECDLFAAARSFSSADISRIVISKVDESGYIGAVASTAIELGKDVAFITNGQRVPEDIEPATARRLAWMLTRTVH